MTKIYLKDPDKELDSPEYDHKLRDLFKNPKYIVLIIGMIILAVLSLGR